MVYHIIIIFCFLSVLFSEQYAMRIGGPLSASKRIAKRQYLNKRLFIILSIYMMALYGLRAYGWPECVGMDTHSYYVKYIKFGKWSLGDVFDPKVNDRGFALLNLLFSKTGLDFWAFSCVQSLVTVGVMMLYIYKYSKNIWMSVFIFLAMGLYTFPFSAVRQGLAIGLCMLAYILSDDVPGWKGILIFFGITYIATTIHASALVFFPVYFIKKLPYKNSTVFIFLGIAALTLLFKSQFANLVVKLAAETSDKYESYEVAESTSAGIMLYVFVFMTVVLRLLTSGSMAAAAKKDNSVYFLLIMLILFPAIQSGGAMMRIYYYYYVFIVVYLPNVLESIDDFKTKQLGYLLLSLFLMWFYLSGNKVGNMLLPYYFFWQM